MVATCEANYPIEASLAELTIGSPLTDMISDDEIQSKAEQFQLRPLDVQKDYVYGWLLAAITQRQTLASQLILKGGNGLRKGYLPETRFSKDLDFSCRNEISQQLLESELREVCTFVTEQTGVQFVDRVTTRNKNLPIPGVQAIEARLYFKSFFGEENLRLRTQLDITQFDRIYLPVQTRRVIHPYSDADKCVASIQFHKLEEILASKMTTLLHRRNPVDLFDLLYSTVFKNEYGVNRPEMVTTFLRKSIFEREPQAAREQLRSIQIIDFRDLWSTLVVPVASLFNFDYVTTNFQIFIDSLFAPFGGAAAVGVAPAPRIARSGGGGGYYGGSNASRSYFSSGIRNTIIDAGRSRSMVSLSYDGYDRLVEPYKIEYYVRKSDGRGLEYFWGWDTTGGKSGKTGIKQFICDKIDSVRPTSRSFQPRYSIEF